LNAGSETNYPYQFGRAFRIGEIKNAPQVIINGQSLETQADVKNRWPDGSVKFAVISVLVPFVSTSQMTLQFQDQPQSNVVPEPIANMLSGYDFDTKINATLVGTGLSGQTLQGAPISARELLAKISDIELTANTSSFSQNSRYWTKGPVCTTLILADNANKSFDFGTDANRSLRPIFQVQFWPSIKAYRVRVIVEQTDISKLQNQAYDVGVSINTLSPKLVFSQQFINQGYGTRWTKQFWGGSKSSGVPTLNEDHNIPYLASTGLLPNFDPNVAISTVRVSDLISRLPNDQAPVLSQGVSGGAMWPLYMGQAGGRPDLGLFPAWHVMGLYARNAELSRGVENMTQLFSAYPVHFRNSDSRPFDTNASSSAAGRIVTRYTHKLQFIGANNQFINNSWVPTEDRFNFVGFSGANKPAIAWQPDGQHQPDPNFLIYLQRGDYWYLEELQFWASWGLFESNPGVGVIYGGRDSQDVSITQNTRGNAWLLRTRARAAVASVDASPEKAYLTEATEKALRKFEGVALGFSPGGLAPINGGVGDLIRNYWASNAPFIAPNALASYWRGASDISNVVNASDTLSAGGGKYDYNRVHSVEAPWQTGMFLQVLSHLQELGFNSGDLKAFVAKNLISLVTNGATDPRHAADYYVPVMDASNNIFSSWSLALNDSNKVGAVPWVSSWEGALGDLDSGSSMWVMAAIAMAANEPEGQTAWNWVKANGYNLAGFNNNPKFAVIPR
jgi:hypothetical protein